MNGEDRFITIENPPPLSVGGRLDRLEIAFRTWGRLDAGAGNAVLVCPALTGDRHLEQWWPGLLGAGRSLDPNTDFIIAADVLGGSGGTTGPHHRRGLRAWGERFPAVSVRDMVSVQRLLIDALGIRRLKLVIGGSLGGMQVLEWAVGHADRVESAIAIAAPARQTAWASALNHAQRRALTEHGDLDLARMIAMLSYRHWDNLDDRFGPDNGSERTAQGWLDHHGRHLRDRFDPVSYRRLMDTMDGHDIGHGRWGWHKALKAVETRTLVVGITSDLLYPPRDQKALAEALPQSSIAWLEAPQGHDAFLIEQERLDRIVCGFRRQGIANKNVLEAHA
ncbi:MULTISPECIES: homoserine O-acetyltransferase [unclassified Wenzhouxiangella]|uniref:homoserine O-acetyltransferase family protein n=1 Tax=unclassified Wenzhouxiangella TaxID=2613841 RepID=UPI000E32A4E4|nr:MULTISPECIES: homoserine O-acetyltransferase [unclassified Wenzhouxiangella]RFF28600.1 homoserine O-acetyltransferase [Wenzhouxiangella sp. 15181]RFP68125.1 homoserine O-acetyltransferase [Wenzhouxiangella sp. 15190]